MTVDPIAVDAKLAGQLFGVGESTWRSLDAGDQVPAPVVIRGSVRWRLDELRAWAEAGCPSRIEWARIQNAANGSAS